MYHLAQVNVGRLRASLDDPMMAEYVALRPVMDALARRSPGFIWRRNGAGSTAKETDLYDDPMVIANVSVWATLEDYVNFVYRSEHVGVLKRRNDWFTRYEGPRYALWWVAQGHQPTAEEAREHLEYLRRYGETPYAFSISKAFPPQAATLPVDFPETASEASSGASSGSFRGRSSSDQSDPT